MSETKTRPTQTSVAAFLDAVEPPQRREDGKAVCDLLQRITGEAPRMWGGSIVGFGSYDYRYDSGHSGTAARVSVAPRKTQLVLYVLSGAAGEADLLARLGKHKTGQSCLYINKLADVDLAVLEAIVRESLAEMNRKYPPA